MKRLWLVFPLLLTGACGSPTEPEPAGPPPLLAATYRLTIMPSPFGCPVGGQFHLVRPHHTLLAITFEGGAAVGRPVTAGSDVELRLERGPGRATRAAVPVGGTFRGLAVDAGFGPLGPSGVRVEAPDDTRVEGMADAFGRGAFGVFSSALTFRDDRGAVTCPASSLRWDLLLEPPR